jgi:hypothetical protein
MVRWSAKRLPLFYNSDKVIRDGIALVSSRKLGGQGAWV